VPVLAGRLLAGALVGVVVVGVVVELELELLLQPAVASAAAATAAKPILLSLRTVVPPGVVHVGWLAGSVEARRDARGRSPPAAAGIHSMAFSGGIEKPG
jgi:hypothetical protein